jgi:UDP-N-acetylglucosamine 3-dehydrogenase
MLNKYLLERMMYMFNIILIGAGTMGRVHAEAYAQMKNVKVVGIVDPHIENAQKLAGPLKSKAFSSFEEALPFIKQVNVIDICLPTHLHKEFVIKSADEGKHVICEKPLAGNLNDAVYMIEYCKEKGVRLFVGHVLRFFPEYKHAKQMIESGKAGTVKLARTSRGGKFPEGSANWFANIEQSGGLILDMIIHDFDFLRWCFGEVERVYAKSASEHGDTILQYALVTLRFRSGVIAHVEGSWAHEGFTMKFELSGTTGVIDYDSSQEQPVVFVNRAKSVNQSGIAVTESPIAFNPYYLELQHFLSCLEQNEESIVTADDAYKAMEISLAAIESIRTKGPVTIPNATQ